MEDNIIRYRAWNKSKAVEKMLDWEFLKDLKVSDVFERDNLVLMQDTTVVDEVSDQPVYAGDIINCQFRWGNGTEEDYIACEVEHDPKYGASISPHDVRSLGRCRYVQVIGNIFEGAEWRGVFIKPDGDKFFAHADGFVNLQESDAEFGDTPQEAYQKFVEFNNTR